MKKNILIISLYYPPIESIASNRIYSFAKYLDKNKYNIYVHTLDEGISFTNDLKDVVVSRSKNNLFFKPIIFKKRSNKFIHYMKVIYNLSIKFFNQDIHKAWIDNSILNLKKLIEEKKIDIIISSFAPTASHSIALALKKEFPRIKWIADMRDEMSASPFLSEKIKKSYRKLEKDIYEYANAITSVSKPILDEFEIMSKSDKIFFREIRNGYDFEIETRKSKNKFFTISYIGNFYGTLNPNNFLKSLSELIEENKISHFQIKFIGVKTHFKIPSNVLKYLKIEKNIPHLEAIKAMKKSDVLLLIHPNNGRKGVFTGKLFEYLATLNPIIALVDTNDVASKLIKECNMGYTAEFDNIEEIKSVILKVFNELSYLNERNINLNIIKKHHRKEQVKRLEKLIEDLMNEK
jgi:glycosyltransferase involved in cell wall biosynthesis